MFILTAEQAQEVGSAKILFEKKKKIEQVYRD